DVPVAIPVHADARLELLVDEDVPPLAAGEVGRVFGRMPDDDVLGGAGRGLDLGPPPVEGVAQARGDVGVVLDDVGLLAGIAVEVVEGRAFEKTPAPPEHGGTGLAHARLAR